MIKIIYFSGTGNTAYIAGLIESRLKERDAVVECSPIEKMEPSGFEVPEMFYLGFPVYACDMPGFVREFIEALPDGKGAKVKLFCTKAWFSGKAAARAARLLNARGYDVLSSVEYKMPGSDGLAFLKKDGRAAKRLLDNFPGDFSGLAGFIDGSGNGLKKSGTIGLGSLFLGGLMKLMEGGLRKKYYADSSCIHCGKCASVCPVGNISVSSETVTFGDECILCMRCVHQCPTEAIQIGKSTVGRLRYKGPSGDFKPPKLRAGI